MSIGRNRRANARLALDRRTFLECVLALGVAAGCSSSSKSSPGSAGAAGEAGASAGSDSVPFGIWEELRAAVRQSPDHLGQVANGLVQGKDPKAIFEFVRDQILTCPPLTNGTITTGMRWGAAATLRGGMGTPREKAELLASLYTQAGLSASVVSGPVSSDAGTAATIYAQQSSRSFAPGVDDATLAEWLKDMGGTAPSSAIDADDSERTALLTPLVPASASASLAGVPPTPASLQVGELPLVAVQVDGQMTYANPSVPGAVFGSSYVLTDPPSAAPAVVAPLPVTVELFASSTTSPTTRTSVAKTTFSADAVVGRQVVLQFVPAVSDLDQLASLRIGDLHVFRPVFSLRDPNADDMAFAENVVVGSTLTLRGDIIETLPDGTVQLNGQPVVGMGASTDMGQVANVATLAVASVNASAFPNISVQVSAQDAKGSAVTGLPAAAFQVAELGVPVGFVETGSPMQPISVALIVDVDGPLGNGDDALELARQVTTQVVAAGGSIIVIYAGVASAPLTAIADVLAALKDNDDDDCWPDIAAAAGTGAVATVFVRDYVGFATGDSASYQNVAYAGPPVLAVGVLDDGGVFNDVPEVAAIVAATGGQALPKAGITDTLAALTQVLSARSTAGNYTLAYTAPATGPAARAVTVATADSKLSGMGMYTVPTTASAGVPPGLCGLFLAVTVGSDTVTRVLAGYSSSAPPSTGNSVSQADLDAVQGAMFGGTSLSFEGAAPTLSTWLDDLLTTKLSMKPLWDAVAAEDVDAIRAARGVTRFYIPPALAVLQCPLAQAEDTLTYPSGLRVVAYSEHIQVGKARVRSLDVLSFPGYLTFASDAATSFSLTLARSARPAVVEGHALADSAVTASSLLAGQTLQFVDATHVFVGEIASIPDAEQQAAVDLLNGYQDFYKFIPAQGSLTAFWAVHSSTGTLLGVLPDGSGGSSSPSACGDLGAADNALDALGLMGDLGIYGVLGKVVAAVFAATAIILEGASDPNFTYDPNQLAKDIAASVTCDIGSDVNASHLAGDAGSAANTVLGIVGGPPLAGCPSSPLAALGC
jgi:hypothetical protein